VNVAVITLRNQKITLRPQIHAKTVKAWFTTHKPPEEGFGLGAGLGGGSDAGEAVLMLAFAAVCFIGAFVSRRLFTKKLKHKVWGDYSGWVCCRIHKDNVEFFTPPKGIARKAIGSLTLLRPIADVETFGVVMSQPKKACFAFSDGYGFELHSDGNDPELDRFREKLNQLIADNRKKH
jgi:hypothetical protein